MNKTLAAILLIITISAAPCFAGTVQLPKTGQMSTYEINDDGALQKGVAWPDPRFVDNGNGTVTDKLTGLVWLKNASCIEGSWSVALKKAGSLAAGQCGLTDGSIAGQWRLPNVTELESLFNAGNSNNASWLISQGFSNVQAGHYWSSTTYAPYTVSAWYVSMADGHTYWGDKTLSNNIWPVR